MGGPRLVILSYPRLTPEIQQVIDDNPAELDLRIVDAAMDEAVDVAHRLERRGDVDAFITGGANAQMVRPRVRLPVIEFSVSGFDLMEAVGRAAAHGRVVPVISYGEPIQELGRLAPVLNVTVKPVTYRTAQELTRHLQELKNLGIRVVVGSSLVCDVAEQVGLRGVLIYSRAAIRNALRVAAEVVRTRQLEAEKAERFQTILSFAYGGIVSTDEAGRITLFNPGAEQILGVPAEQAVGRPASEVIPNSRLETVLQSGKPALNQVHKLAAGPVLANWVPICVDGRVCGVTATFQDAASIQSAEQKIRRTLADRGLSAQYSFEDIAAASPVTREILTKARHYARADSTVLVLGETGTGKELFAQSIHNASRRSQGPFVAVNCAALPESLLESELFGYEEGAFTGARRGGKPGLFELAHGGTIFLDEIGEVPRSIQARLLRALQERQIMRIGGNRVIPVDIRVVAATNRDLAAEARAGRFRADLFYRLNILRLELPPLRERPEDIPQLFRIILVRHNPGLARELAPELSHLLPLMLRYAWPGNVRELENLVERFAVMAVSDNPDTGRTGHFPPPEALRVLEAELRALAHAEDAAHFRAGSAPPAALHGLPPSPLAPIPLARILAAIAAVGGNRAEAARRLGISRTTLYRRLQHGE